jgi:hypothetical protein
VPVGWLAGLAVVPVVVVAAPPVPVGTPARNPTLTGAPVIVRDRRGVGLGSGSRSQSGEPQARGHYEGRCRNTCDVFHTWFSTIGSGR